MNNLLTTRLAKLSAKFFAFTAFLLLITSSKVSSQVLLDANSAGNGSSSWSITTTQSNEVILISVGGYGTISNAVGTVTVNGFNATNINEAINNDGSFSFSASIWAYTAATPGVYSISCNESGQISPFYMNYAASFYQPSNVLTVSNVLASSIASGANTGTLTTSITTASNNAVIYGFFVNNDNGGSGTINFGGALTVLGHNYISDGVDAAHGDGSFASPGTYTITATSVGASNPYAAFILVTVEPSAPLCSYSAGSNVIANDNCNGGTNGEASVSISGGSNPPYTYLWSPGGQTTDTASGLTAGTYTVVVTDNVGCQNTVYVTITEPTALQFQGAQSFSYSSSSEQSWTVPAGITQLSITTVGGSGGNAEGADPVLNTLGGMGATINGVVNVTPGDNVMVLVGGSGYTERGGYGGSGGGGTYVWDATSNTLLQVAGGGGGAAKLGTFGSFANHENGGDGQSNVAILNNPTTDPHNYSAAGGSGGNGGNVEVSDNWAAGAGAGWLSNGATGSSVNGGTTTGGADPANGGAGGSGGVFYISPGGFGGGGGANVGGGGGGGYNGGGGGGDYTGGAGGGGGSYCAGTVISTSASNVGNGIAAISFSPNLVVNNGCNNANNGTITAPSVTGGTAPYNYSWSDASSQTTATATGLSPGTYTVNITDANGCLLSASATVSNPPLLTISLTSQSSGSCGGQGFATFTASGGTPDYTYNWAPSGGTDSTATGLSAGSYTITVTDANGCTATSSVTLIGFPGISAVAQIINNDSCNGESNGSAFANVTGTTAPYTYSWSTGATTDSISGLSAGSYTVIVTDMNGCTATAIATINEPAPLQICASAPTVVNFNYTGSIDNWTVPAGVTQVTITAIGATGGNVPVFTPVGGKGAEMIGTFAVAPSSTLNILVGQAGGTSGTNGGGGGGGGTFVTTSSNSPLIVAGGGGGVMPTSNGYVSVGIDAVTGTTGQNGYSALGSNPANYGLGGVGGDGATNVGPSNGPCGGNGGGLLTDGQFFSCCITNTFGIAFVNGGAGGLGGCGAGGTGGFGGGAGGGNTGGGGGGGYSGGGGSWDEPTNGGGGGSFNAGTAQTNIAAFNASGNGSVTIAYSTVTAGSINVYQSVGCFNGANGAMGISCLSGGTAPYTFLWSNSETTDSATGLSAGTYTVTVTDANGCTLTASATVTQPTLLTLTLASQSALSCGSFGSATFTAAGGTPSYTYLWSPGGYTTATVTTLSGGSYNVTVTDSNGCTANSSVTITSSPGISVTTVIINNDSCNSECNGVAYADVTGVTPPYTFSWSNGATTDTVTGLCAGDYTVTVTDTNGCTATATTTVTQPLLLGVYNASTITFNYTSSSEQSWTVPAGITSVSITTTGGSGGDAEGGDPVLNTVGGHGATINGVVNVIPGNVITVLVGGAGYTQFGGYGGSGGGGTYVWDATANNLLQVAGGGGGAAKLGTFGSFANHENGGDGQSNTAILNNPTTDPYNFSAPGGSGGNGGSVESGDNWAASGGAGWFSDGATASSFDGGTTVGGSDPANGGAGGSGGVQYTSPGGYGGGGGGNIGGGGGAGYNGGGGGGDYTGGSGGGGGSFCAGSVLTTSATNFGNGIASISYSIPGSLVINQQISCFGGSNGMITANVEGGTRPYTFLWSPAGGTDSAASGLSAGSYTVLITDANGCSATASATLTQPTLLTLTLASQSSFSCGGAGFANFVASGGTPSYTYSWSPGGYTTASVTTLSGGTYTVTVTDANGCTAIDSVLINSSPGISAITIVTNNDSCASEAIGSAYVVVTGTTSPYTYSWTNGSTTDSITGLSAGNYTVVVTDTNGCTATAVATITQPLPLLFGSTINFNYTSSSEQSWTIPAGVTQITVTTTAGSGGNASFYQGGTGATVNGVINVTPGDNVMVLVGGQGYQGQSFGYGGGGGGGTYVWDATTNTLLQAAGGGGGAARLSGEGGGAGQTNTAILNNPTTDPFNEAASGGSGGNGGNTISNSGQDYSASGGAGWFSNGVSASSVDGGNVVGGADPGNGGAGGSGGNYPGIGGYGGGGGACVGGGGGAGYNGGGGGGYISGGGGGGGGSYCLGSILSTASSTGNGFASIIYSTPNIIVLSEVSCFGGSNGSLSAAATGGTAPYTYLWTPNASTDSVATNLSAGTYTVTVTDANGCTLTASATITQPPLLVASVISTNGLCFGTGSATVTPSGGTPQYTYLWSPGGQTTATITGLTSGSYNVTVTDSNGCTATNSVTISQPTQIVVTTTVISEDSCNSDNTGSAYATVSGGTPAYTYLWSNGATTDTITGLTAGTYTVLVTDNNGCSVTQSVTITQPLAIAFAASVPFAYTSSFEQSWTVPAGITQITVNTTAGSGGNGRTTAGGNAAVLSGVVNVTPGDNIMVLVGGQGYRGFTYGTNGGGGGGTYVWDATTSTLLQVAGGGGGASDYAGENGGDGQTNVGILNNPTSDPFNEAAAGGSGGNGGSAYNNSGYDYSASGGAGWFSNGQSASSVDGGNVVGGADPANGGAGGSGGLFTYAATGGYGGGGGGEVGGGGGGGFNGGGGGNYSPIYASGGGGGSFCAGTVMSTSLNTGNGVASILYNVAPVVTQEVSCFGGSNGVITAQQPAGGTPPFNYNWSPSGGTNLIASGLSAGTYTLTATDSHGCMDTISVTVTQPNLLVVAINANNIGCDSTQTLATANVTGGTGTYTYTWSGGQTTDTATLTAGTYSLTVTDSNSCSTTASVTITQLSCMSVRDTVLANVNCFGNNTGSASAIVTGGIAPFTYLWSNGETTDTATGLSAGTYTVTVTDNNSTSATASVTITQPASALAAVGNDIGDVSCFNGNNGSASVTASGGTAAYTYAWSTGATTDTISSLSAGTYTVLVTDNNGCTTTASVTISQPTVLTANATDLGDELCFGGNIGSASVTAGGGTSPYTYLWSNSSATSSISALTAGTYTVLVTDNNGCTATASVTITQPTAVSVSTTQTNVTCLNASNGSATANASGGTSPYTYLWSNAATTITTSGLSAGTYTIVVTDNNGCTGSNTVTITQPATGMRDSIINVTNVGCNGGNGGAASIGIRGGTPPYTYAWSNGATTNRATGLSAGTYTVSVTSLNDCNSVLTVTITQPALLVDTLTSITYPSCHGGNGSATVGVTGGTGPYTYTWTRGVSTTSSATGLIAGSYTVSVRDNHGCSASVGFTITQPVAIRDSIVLASSHSITCKGNQNGYITVGVLGGTAPFTYTWTPNVGSTATISNLSIGTYSVSITDAGGCTGTVARYTITQPLYVLTDSNSVLINVGCFGGAGGEISIGTKGGTSPYTYAWSNGNTRYTESGLSAGTYTIAITDANGCNQTVVSTVTQPTAALQASVASNNAPACHGGRGSASVSVTGGTPAYTYVWVPNVSTTSSCSNISAGTYTVTIKDSHGCNTVVSFTVVQPVQIRDSIVTALKRNVDCRGSQDGTSTVGVTYGTPPYTYLWAPTGQTNATATGLSAGVYTVTVTDANGCSGTAATTTITAPAARLFDSLAKETCVNNVITATLGTIGGTQPYTYLWNPGGGTRQQMTGLSPGTYTITVTDAHGCTFVFGKTLICGATPPPHDGQVEDTATVKCCAGLDNINLYPNPNTGQFTLAGLDKGMIIEMFDYTGKMISTVTASNLTMQLSLVGQPNGIYLIRIMDKSGTLVSQKKVVKTQ